MSIYVESSALLSMLFVEPPATLVRRELVGATLVCASSLTLLETRRAIIRGEAIGAVPEGRASDMRLDLSRMAAAWSIFDVDDDVVERAGRPFPWEPIRALDAIHLATALAVRETVGPVSLLSLDERIRRSARELGFAVAPGSGDTIHDGA